MTMRPHVSQRILISAPVRITVHVSPPHGCFFLVTILSPIEYTIFDSELISKLREIISEPQKIIDAKEIRRAERNIRAIRKVCERFSYIVFKVFRAQIAGGPFFSARQGDSANVAIGFAFLQNSDRNSQKGGRLRVSVKFNDRAGYGR